MQTHWIADRMGRIEASGIRKVFDLARSLKDPVNFSIGQPHFDVPQPIKAAAIAAIQQGRNGYTVTQGIAELREKIQASVQKQFGHADRQVLITSGTSGGLLLSLFCTVNPGDEVIFFDPYFVMYPNLVGLAGGKAVIVDTYPDFQIDVGKVRSAITPKTKVILANSPANPTGVVQSRETLHALAKLCQERGILLISDEIYRAFCYDQPFVTPTECNEETLVLDGFSKTYGMTGWRLGFAHGPKRIIEEMAKLQQFSFVCAPSMVQYAGVAALDFDVTPLVNDYRKKRDRIVSGLRDRFEIVTPGGAFYAFPQVPWGSATEFVTECIRNNLLAIPGNVFSARDTHLRISYAVDDATLERGIEILNRVAQQ